MSQKRGFQMAACTQKRGRTDSIPKAKDIIEEGFWCPPPEDVLEKIGGGSTWFIGMDIETNDWEESRGNKGNIGQLGFYNLCVPRDLDARIVQLGWSFGSSDKAITTKEFLILPDGFIVSDKAAQYHGISNEMAIEKGRCLKGVLIDFMNDVQYVVGTQNGKMVCHHMEFDGGIITNEISRCGMSIEQFESFAKCGLCTMAPAVGRWVLKCNGEDVGPSRSMNTLSLKTLVKILLPEDQKLLEKHHSAGIDSVLVLKIAFALNSLSKKMTGEQK
jgi:hypothetical protein